ncbi:hypothetical protein C8J57DRAFT_1632643 [Mycena rebaudengoi]|nr:hypothetical protein C8J57DRAFT_1632643 [Mycena rebaudengoi]
MPVKQKRTIINEAVQLKIRLVNIANTCTARASVAGASGRHKHRSGAEKQRLPHARPPLGAMRINTPSGTLVTSTTLGTRARARQYHSTRRLALMDKLGAPSQAGGVSGAQGVNARRREGQRPRKLRVHTCIRVFMTPLHGPYAHHHTHNLSRLARFTADTLAWEGVCLDAYSTSVTRGSENEKRREKHLTQPHPTAEKHDWHVINANREGKGYNHHRRTSKTQVELMANPNPSQGRIGEGGEAVREGGE